MLHIDVEIRRFHYSRCDKRRRDERSGESPLSQPPCLLSKRTRLLRHFALLAQSQKKSNESNRGMLDTRAQGAHEIPNTRSSLQQPTLELSSSGAYRQKEHRRKLGSRCRR